MAGKKITAENIQGSLKNSLGGFGDMFAGMEEKTPAADKPAAEPAPKKKTTRTKKAEPAAADKPQKYAGRVFSVWMQESTIEQIQAYTEATGRKKTDILTAAVTEYFNRHKLTAEQKTAYQKKQKNLQDITKNL